MCVAPNGTLQPLQLHGAVQPEAKSRQTEKEVPPYLPMARTSDSNMRWRSRRSMDTANTEERYETPRRHDEAEEKPATRVACHERQRRYREKQRGYIQGLETSVKSLRMEVDELLAKRQTAVLTTATRPTRAPSVLPSSSMPREDMSGEALAVMRECLWCLASCSMAQQMQFLQSAMRCDVRHGDLVGCASVLEQWTRLAIYFDGAPLVLEQCYISVDMLDADTALGSVAAVLEVRVTHTTLAAVFPYALTDSYVQETLLRSATLRLPMTAHFHFDAQGKVARYDPELDFVSGLHSVLGNYEDVINTLRTANVGASGQLRAPSRVRTGSPRQMERPWMRCVHQQDRHGRETRSAAVDRLNTRLSMDFLLSTAETL